MEWRACAKRKSIVNCNPLARVANQLEEWRASKQEKETYSKFKPPARVANQLEEWRGGEAKNGDAL